MSEIDPTQGKITPSQQPIQEPLKPAEEAIKPASSDKQDGWNLDKFFGRPVTEEEKTKFRNNMLKMIQTQIQHDQKKAKETARRMKDVIEGRDT